MDPHEALTTVPRKGHEKFAFREWTAGLAQGEIEQLTRLLGKMLPRS